MRGPPAASRLLRERPEAWVYGVGAACWAALILAPGQAHRHAPAAFEWLPALSHWLLMIGAMMLPMAAMAVRHVALRSFRHRRGRAMAGCAAGYAAVWLAAGPLYLAAGLVVPRPAGGAPVAAILVAAAWQSTNAKRRALRQCHRTVPLAPAGWRADRACLAFGLAHGGHCLVSCWALMLIAFAAGHHPLAMLLVGLVALCERRGHGAEPLRRPADAWHGAIRLWPSLAPSRAR